MRGFVCALVLALGCAGCADPLPSIPASQLVGHVHDASAPPQRAELERRAGSDATLAAWLDENGPPDYVSFDSERSVTLFYVARDRYARFERGLIRAASDPPATGTIRATDHRFFSNRDRQRLGELRRERALLDERDRRRARTPAASDDVPASPEP